MGRKKGIKNTNNPLVDLTGKKINNWIVLKRAPDKYKWRTYWLCKCKCGLVFEVSGQALKNGTSSCCKKCSGLKIGKRSIKHGYCKNNKKISEYHIWNSIKNRCYNKNDKGYKHYGARGIKVCKEWIHDFSKFLEEMGKKPFKNSSIERIDVNKDYNKENCKWIDKHYQAKNTTRNPVINGKRICINDLSKKINKCRFWVSRQIKNGYQIEELEKLEGPPYKKYK